MNDKKWKILVTSIANSSVINKESVEEAAKYLWDEQNWARLKETSHGKFLREVHNVCPDYGLRRMYKEEILRGE